MTFGHFLNMERRLLSAVGLHPKVVDLAMNIITSQESQLEQIRSRSTLLRRGVIRPLVADPIFRWHRQRQRHRDLRISTTKLVAATTIIADFTVLFTTRDWSVVGALSAIAGAAAELGVRNQGH